MLCVLSAFYTTSSGKAQRRGTSASFQAQWFVSTTQKALTQPCTPSKKFDQEGLYGDWRGMSRHQTARRLPLPNPRQFFASIISSTGAFGVEYPTFTLSYVDCDLVPDDSTLGDIQAFSVDFNPDPNDEFTPLTITAFLQPRKELLDLSDSVFLKIGTPTKETNKILHRIQNDGRYIVVINTSFYFYRALVDDYSGEVLESSIEYRFLT